MQVVHVTRHGGPEVLEIVDLPVPEPQAGEALLRVLAVSVNHLDLFVRRGMPGFPIPFPRIPGCDGIGEIVALGKGVAGFAVGQRVILEPGYNPADSSLVREGMEHLAEDYSIRGEHGDGFEREFVALPSRYLTPLPAGIDPVQAAAVPLAFLTAWTMVHLRARVRAGETVLVLGGASGVGSAAIQLCRAEGARVLATAGSEEKRALARELGAEIALDHRSSDWPREVRDATGGEGVDVVIEHIGPATWAGSMKALGRNARLVTCGGTSGAKVEIVLPHLFIKNLSILGSTMGPRSAFPAIFEGIARGRWRPVVDRVMPLSAVREAHAALEAREVSGKIVLVPGR
jgi:NADPH:quinone reductase-like Zn-dependent oxidoreductase